MLEGAAGAPAGVSFFQALGDFVAAGADRADPKAYAAGRQIVFNIKRMGIVVFAEADGGLSVERFACLGAADVCDREVALLGSVGERATRQIAAIGAEFGMKVHAQMIERAMNDGRRIVFLRKHGQPRSV